jgi:hypothetical protein
MPYIIGDKVWYKGDEVEVISEAYVLHGGLFQDAITEDRKMVTIATPEQSTLSYINAQKEWRDSQEQFSRLHKINK